MIVIGLTGSIGMGKSFVAQCFEEKGIGVFDADEEIHILMREGGEAILHVSKEFPEALNEEGSIDRSILGNIVFKDPKKLQKLEAILHPLVRKKGDEFLQEEQDNNAPMIVQDIPLLYETGADSQCHVIIVVSAPLSVQQERVMQRESMTDDKYKAIMKLQMLQKEKEDRADFVIQTDCDKQEVREQLDSIIKQIQANY